MHLRSLASIAILALTACAQTTSTGILHTQGTPRAAVSPTRSAEECRDLLASVWAHPDSFAPSSPQAKTLVLPPMEGVPRGWGRRAVTATLLVDAAGNVVADSTTIDPALPAGRYDRAIRSQFALMEFFPAVLEGCAVAGRAKFTVTLPNSGVP